MAIKSIMRVSGGDKVSAPWWGYYTVVLQDVTIGGNRVKDTWDVSVLFLKTICECTAISVKVKL